MKRFPGFTSGTEVMPTQFFEELLPEIETLSELKVTVFGIYLLNQFEGDQRYLLRSDFAEQPLFMKGLSPDAETAEKLLDEGLALAEERGTFLKIGYDETDLYFLNSPKGRAALTNLQEGTWVPNAFLHLSGTTNLFRPNIFKLYEENIGPLTPMIADVLRDTEKTYPTEWIEEAMQEAVMNNARSWRYIEAILKNRKENGRNGTFG